MNKLSAYTIAANCTDISDIQSGIDEINEVIQHRFKQNKKVPSYFYIRLKKLETKLKKKQAIGSFPKFSVAIRLAINPTGLEMAIRHCLLNDTALTKQNIIKTIRTIIVNQGSTILSCPELWDDKIKNINDREVQVVLQNFNKDNSIKQK